MSTEEINTLVEKIEQKLKAISPDLTYEFLGNYKESRAPSAKWEYIFRVLRPDRTPITENHGFGSTEEEAKRQCINRVLELLEIWSNHKRVDKP